MRTTKLKTPLRYPGGKSRAMHEIGKHVPRNIRSYREPFLGGGSIAIWVAQNIPEAEIWVNDLYDNLFIFWTQLQTNSSFLINEITKIKDEIKDDAEKGREKFYSLKENIQKQNDSLKAVYFYALNKMSFSGLGESSGFSASSAKSNFSYNGINMLERYSELIQSWKITSLDYKDILTDDPDTLIILDPPYEISSYLYGKNGSHHKGFDHDDFALNCNNCKAKQLITYNSDANIKNRFPNWKQIEWDLTYSMRSDEVYTEKQKNRKELILKNY
jgi:DNA adenine methylase Dam